MSDLEKARAFFGKDIYASETTGIVITEVGDRYAKVELDLDERHYNALGHVMGGVYFTMSDFAFAIASNFNSDPCVTLASQIVFLNSARGRHLTAEARCLKDGRNTSFFEISITDEQGTPVAKVTTEGRKING